MKLHWMFLITLLISLDTHACPSSQHQDLSQSQPPKHSTAWDDRLIILHALLPLTGGSTPEAIHGSNSPAPGPLDELAQFKMLEQVYLRSIEPGSQGALTLDQLTTLLWFNFYANAVQSGAFLAYLASDLMPIYLKQPALFIEPLKAQPFLAASACRSLHQYFGFEGLNSEKKTPFITRDLKSLLAQLPERAAKACQHEFSP